MREDAIGENRFIMQEQTDLQPLLTHIIDDLTKCALFGKVAKSCECTVNVKFLL